MTNPGGLLRRASGNVADNEFESDGGGNVAEGVQTRKLISWPHACGLAVAPTSNKHPALGSVASEGGMGSSGMGTSTTIPAEATKKNSHSD
jgi:hypothetical protein